MKSITYKCGNYFKDGLRGGDVPYCFKKNCFAGKKCLLEFHPVVILYRSCYRLSPCNICELGNTQKRRIRSYWHFKIINCDNLKYKAYIFPVISIILFQLLFVSDTLFTLYKRAYFITTGLVMKTKILIMISLSFQYIRIVNKIIFIYYLLA